MTDEERAIRRDLWKAEYDADVAATKLQVCKLLEEDVLDDDGYPTDTALKIVEIWHWSDPKGWFEFINSIWHLKSWGWSEGGEKHDWDKDEQVYREQVYRYNISTAGWSGNESIISVMQRNDVMWHTTWVQSRRGGHYIFEVKEF